jgi:Fe2+ or Zn2+ uptake regulation protein
MNDEATIIRAAGLRITAGRIAVLEVLTRTPHTDAESVFGAVLASVPGTSVQSVYNILGDLTDAGILRRIEPAGSAALYERRIGDNHHHVVCSRCGAVADIDCVHGEAPCLTPGDTSGYTIHTAEITFWGLCESCAVLTTEPPSHHR